MSASNAVDRCFDDGNHPTRLVMACSPDPVLSHDGKTSQACRRCTCGRFSSHTCCMKHPNVPGVLVSRAGQRMCFECSFVVWLLTWMRLTFACEPVPEWSGAKLYAAEHNR